MLHFALLAAVVMGGQTSTLITPRRPVTTGWESTPTVAGKPVFMRFELQAGQTTVDGPRLSVPCVGQSEEANMKGWSDGNVDYRRLSSDHDIEVGFRMHLEGDRAAARDTMREFRREEYKVTEEITAMYRVRPGEGSGPRETENVYKYLYRRMDLLVYVGKSKIPYLLGSYYVPNAEPQLVSTKPCSAPPTETALIGSIGGEYLPPTHREISGYVGATFSPETAGMVTNCGFKVTGVDINTVMIQDPSFMDVPALKWIYLPTGTVLVPGKGGIQSMITVEPLLLTAGGQLQALSGGSVGARSVTVHCLEIDKEQPDSSVTFIPARLEDPVLRNLAAFTQKSVVRGPWDQARIWIYSDKASLERINKRLAIGCPPGMFVRSLYEVQTMGGLDEKDLANAELFNPEYLGGVSNRKEAAGWFAWVLASHHTEALLKYLGGGGKDLASLVTSSNPLAADQFSRVTTYLLAHGNPDVRLATLKFLDAQDPAALKKAFGKPGPNWERHTGLEGEEAELGKKLKDKLSS